MRVCVYEQRSGGRKKDLGGGEALETERLYAYEITHHTIGLLSVSFSVWKSQISFFQKINCDDIKIYFQSRRASDSGYLLEDVSLSSRKLQIYEKKLDIDRICGFVEKFRAGLNEVGSAYLSISDRTGFSEELWERLKNRFPIEEEHK